MTQQDAAGLSGTPAQDGPPGGQDQDQDTGAAFDAALAAAVALVRGGRRFLVSGHARLDGDALGAMLVTAHGLRLLGKEVHLYNEDPVPRRLQFLPGAGEVVRKLPGLRYDARLVHDTGARHLLGDRFPGPDITGPVVVVDHHAVVSDIAEFGPGSVALRDERAATAAIVSWRLLSALGISEAQLQGHRALATALLVSLVEDPGWFRYPGTDPETLRLAGLCVAAGAEPWQLALQLEESMSESSLRLLSLVLATLERHHDGRLAILSMTDGMMQAADATPDDVLKFVNYARALRGVAVGVFITAGDKQIYVSLRGKGEVDVGAIASRFGGGGHRNAAGCTIKFPPAVAAGPTDDTAAPVDRVAVAKAQLIAAVGEALARP